MGTIAGSTRCGGVRGYVALASHTETTASYAATCSRASARAARTGLGLCVLIKLRATSVQGNTAGPCPHRSTVWLVSVVRRACKASSTASSDEFRSAGAGMRSSLAVLSNQGRQVSGRATVVWVEVQAEVIVSCRSKVAPAAAPSKALRERQNWLRSRSGGEGMTAKVSRTPPWHPLTTQAPPEVTLPAPRRRLA
jgi:hypothetical protein